VGEQYVRPPLVPREAPPAWRAVWRFRLVALLLLAVLVLIGYRVFQHFSGATDQDPGLSSMARTSAGR
jgi:type II secretory pathway component PulL